MRSNIEGGGRTFFNLAAPKTMKNQYRKNHTLPLAPPNPREPMPTLRSRMKKSRCELHDTPQTMLGTIVNAQVEEDLRNDILKHLNDADAMSTCLVSKGAYVAVSSYREMTSRVKAASDDSFKCAVRGSEMVQELPSSTNPVRVLADIAEHREEMLVKDNYFKELCASFQTMRYWDFRWAAEKKVKEMAAVIEKQALQIVALKRLYKAK